MAFGVLLEEQHQHIDTTRDTKRNTVKHEGGTELRFSGAPML